MSLPFTIQISISDFLTFSFALFGIVVSLIYILIQWNQPSPEKDTSLEEKLTETLRFSNSESPVRKFVVEDYRVINEEVARRDSITLLTGTILITASFLLLAARFSPFMKGIQAIAALSSIGLYITWMFFLHETAKKLNTISFKRIRAIETAVQRSFGLDFGIHNYNTRETQGQGVWWLRMRRRIFWYVILLLLSLVWLLLSLDIRAF